MAAKTKQKEVALATVDRADVSKVNALMARLMAEPYGTPAFERALLNASVQAGVSIFDLLWKYWAFIQILASAPPGVEVRSPDPIWLTLSTGRRYALYLLAIPQ